jgi:hypothetical protein
MFNEDEENRPERCGRHRVRCFALFSLCSAVTGQLLGRGKQSLKRALNTGPESILPGWNFDEGHHALRPRDCLLAVSMSALSCLRQLTANFRIARYPYQLAQNPVTRTK